MADEEPKDDPGEDPFLLEAIYPDAQTILRTPPPEDQLTASCVYLLDTNALLAPLKIGKAPFNDVQRILRNVASQSRLFVPAHVLREYAKNRTKEIATIHTHLNQLLGNMSNQHEVKIPLLESTTELQELRGAIEALAAPLKAYKEKIKNLIDHVQKFNWNDPVTSLYAEVFKGSVVEHGGNKEDIAKEFEHRAKHGIPPGYKDSGKPSNRMGDYIIWKSILRIGLERKTNVVFVTNDQKPDWYVGSSKNAMFARYELVDEFARLTGGHHLLLMPYSKFLDKMGADKATVAEVRAVVQTDAVIAKTKRKSADSWLFKQLSLAAETVASTLEYCVKGNFKWFYESEFDSASQTFITGADLVLKSGARGYNFLDKMARILLELKRIKSLRDGEMIEDEMISHIQRQASKFIGLWDFGRTAGRLNDHQIP